MLDYENQSFLDILHEDGLLIVGKGLGLEQIFKNVLKCYADPGNLVLVLGTSSSEEDYFMRILKEELNSSSSPSAKRITAEVSVQDRKSVYLEGGVLFITPRILTVDLLTDRIPTHLVTGILLYRAHKALDSCQDAFILRLYRQRNKTGFIKAFSDCPTSFRQRIERIMRHLFVKNLYLCPRFRSDVVSCFKTRGSPEVIELHLSMTKDMLTLQTAILDLIHFTIQELKRINPHLRQEDPDLETDQTLTVENAMSRYFHKLLQRELDPVWHRLSGKTKQLVQDLKTLQRILLYLTQYDCITFATLVSALRTTENAMKTGGWMLRDSAETLFLTCETRVSEKRIEENPKWNAVLEIIKEIKDDRIRDSFPSERVLILTADTRTSQQLQDVIATGCQSVLRRLYNESASLVAKYGKRDEEDVEKPAKRLKTTEIEPSCSVTESPVIIIQSFHTDPFEMYKLLNEVKPRYVVMYDVNMTIVRQLEVFRANLGPGFEIRVYFLLYGKSVEEQSYLTTLRAEKEAFEHLIKAKETMVIPEDREGRTQDSNTDLLRGDPTKNFITSSSSSTRVGGIVNEASSSSSSSSSSKVIVDMREFRCELPSLIHKRGIDVEPITLEVGDYILTPEICVERKSISDLIGSLNSGRLYNQATSMTRFYAKPMLLIEFDQNQPFALQGRYYMSRDLASSDIVARLQLLTIHFPKLCILWSPSPHATAELFEELKKGRDEPDASKAASISIDVIDEYASSDKYNPAIQDFVSKLPGVTSKNVYAILNRLTNLGDLIKMTEMEIAEMIDSSSNAKLIYDSLHRKQIENVQIKSTTSVKPSRFKSRSKKEKA